MSLKRPNPKARSPKKPLPADDILLDLGIDPADFAWRHRVVMCPLCERRGRAQFVMLAYAGPERAGEARVVQGFRSIQKTGLNSQGQPRINWFGGCPFAATCDLDHVTTLTQAGEIKCSNAGSDI